MDERCLKELELASVVRLYGLGEVRGSRFGLRDEATAVEALAPGTSNLAAGVTHLDWGPLRDTVRACTACGLCKSRKQAVFGMGHLSAPWMFIGEGPGADEDALGDPFVGRAGKLLDHMLAALRIARGREVYVANVVKCRPPGDREPTPEEAAACAPFLDRQIALVRPKLIVALGESAANRLLRVEAAIASLRGKVHRYQDTPVVVTYHPAYLLRTPAEKARAWEDLLFARRTLLQESATS
jgi:uracil-DNA glycosylase family 4